MLTHILALIVGFGSLAIYLAAFFFPEVHRKNDFIWSGVGLFYALVLWVFTPRIGGWFFLGQLAAVALLIWFGWQTFSLRRQITPTMQQTPVPSAEQVKANISEQATKLSLPERVGGLFKSISGILPGKGKQQASEVPIPATSNTEDTSAATIGKTLVDVIEEEEEEAAAPSTETTVPDVENTDETAIDETTSEPTPPETSPEELVETVSENVDVEEIAPEAETTPEKIPPTDLPQG